MSLTEKPKRYRFPSSIISCAIWQYHRFNLSIRDVQEQLAYRGIIVSHETIRNWCVKFSRQFKDVLQKQERKISDKWHLDEMSLRINGESFVLWRAVDEQGMELDVFLQKRRNKASAIRFLSRLLQAYSSPRVIVTDKLRSYKQPIKRMYPKTIRKMIYTTNAIESVNSGLRKITNNKRIFPNEESVFKSFYLTLNYMTAKWTMPIQNWGEALSHFMIKFEDRI